MYEYESKSELVSVQKQTEKLANLLDLREPIPMPLPEHAVSRNVSHTATSDRLNRLPTCINSVDYFSFIFIIRIRVHYYAKEPHSTILLSREENSSLHPKDGT